MWRSKETLQNTWAENWGREATKDEGERGIWRRRNFFIPRSLEGHICSRRIAQERFWHQFQVDFFSSLFCFCNPWDLKCTLVFVFHQLPIRNTFLTVLREWIKSNYEQDFLHSFKNFSCPEKLEKSNGCLKKTRLPETLKCPKFRMWRPRNRGYL